MAPAARRLRDLDAYAVLLPPQDEMLQDWDPLVSARLVAIIMTREVSPHFD